MDEDQFWVLIDKLQGRADESGCHQLYLALRKLDPEQIVSFQDRFSEVLWRLDLRSIAKQKWRAVSEPRWLPRIPGISADGFLYARCAAVAEGRETVQAILEDHRKFRRRWDIDAEALLSVAIDAYEGNAGREWNYERDVPYSYETGSNAAGGWRRGRGTPPGNPQ